MLKKENNGQIILKNQTKNTNNNVIYAKKIVKKINTKINAKD